MQKILYSITKAVNDFGDSAGSFTIEVWTALALVTVVGGYFLLRGNMFAK